MARYLVVAHQTAESPELIEKVRALATSDPAAEFVLLVPATPIAHLLTWVEGEAVEVAAKTAEAARARLEGAGARVVRTAVGDASPLQAIEDELMAHPGQYDAIVFCTFPPGLSRWLRLDLPHQAERRFVLPIIHVMAEVRTAAKR